MIKSYRKLIMRLLRIQAPSDVYIQVCEQMTDSWREVIEEGEK